MIYRSLLLINVQAVICLDFISMSGGVSVVAMAHSGELLALILTGNEWECVSLSTDHLVWPSDYRCQNISMSELSDGSILVGACCCDVVGVWRMSLADQWTSQVLCSFNIPLLCSLILSRDTLVAATSNHQLFVVR